MYHHLICLLFFLILFRISGGLELVSCPILSVWLHLVNLLVLPYFFCFKTCCLFKKTFELETETQMVWSHFVARWTCSEGTFWLVFTQPFQIFDLWNLKSVKNSQYILRFFKNSQSAFEKIQTWIKRKIWKRTHSLNNYWFWMIRFWTLDFRWYVQWKNVFVFVFIPNYLHSKTFVTIFSGQKIIYVHAGMYPQGRQVRPRSHLNFQTP